MDLTVIKMIITENKEENCLKEKLYEFIQQRLK